MPVNCVHNSSCSISSWIGALTAQLLWYNPSLQRRPDMQRGDCYASISREEVPQLDNQLRGCEMAPPQMLWRDWLERPNLNGIAPSIHRQLDIALISCILLTAGPRLFQRNWVYHWQLTQRTLKLQDESCWWMGVINVFWQAHPLAPSVGENGSSLLA